jgi:hypothetical protein
MKKGFFVILAITLAAFMTSPALADRKGQASNHEQSSGDRHDMGHGQSPHHNGADRDRGHDREMGHDQGMEHHRDGDRGHDYDYRQRGHHPHGYFSQPHGRHYGNPHMFGGHAYGYDGHWNSWEAWEGYRRLHADRFHHGSYYRESGHLFFRFCDPVGAACFFFSIGG